MASRVGIAAEDAKNVLGRMWRHEFWEDCETGNQKANPAGSALKFVTAYALQRWGDKRYDYREEQALTVYWPGIALPSVKSPKADVLVVERVGSRPVAVVSCKWSMRTDRISNATRDCAAAKATAHRMTGTLRFYVVCHEYDGSRIAAMLGDACIDGVALVNLPVMEAIGILSPELEAQRARRRLLSLDEFIDSTASW